MNYPWQTNVFYPSPDMAQSETYGHKYKFNNVLGILLQVPTVQFGIIFDKRVEIHLDYRKQKISSKKKLNFYTTVCMQPIYVQKSLEYERHF